MVWLGQEYILCRYYLYGVTNILKLDYSSRYEGRIVNLDLKVNKV